MLLGEFLQQVAVMNEGGEGANSKLYFLLFWILF